MRSWRRSHHRHRRHACDLADGGRRIVQRGGEFVGGRVSPIGAVIGEYIGSNEGLGYFILYASQTYDQIQLVALAIEAAKTASGEAPSGTTTTIFHSIDSPISIG